MDFQDFEDENEDSGSHNLQLLLPDGMYSDYLLGK